MNIHHLPGWEDTDVRASKTVTENITKVEDIQCLVLTGDEVMSSGDAYLDGVSVTENITKVRHTMFSTDRR